MSASSIAVTHEFHTWRLLKRVAREHGYFEDEGIDPELSYFPPGTQSFEGENTVDADWWHELDSDGATHGVCEWNAIQEAAETDRTIVATYDEWERVLFADHESDVHELADLEGRSIGINKYATSFFSLREFLEANGFAPDEIVLRHVGSPAERFEAVKQGDVDAIGVLEPFTTLGRYDERLRTVTTGPCRGAVVSRADVSTVDAAALRRALNRAVDEVNTNRKTYRDAYLDLLTETEGRPAFADVDFECLRESFTLSKFLPVSAPDEARLDQTTDWMCDHGFVEPDTSVATHPVTGSAEYTR